jgi:hypothetical protein
MTEAEWLACTDSRRLVAFLPGKPSERKLRLLAVACCRRIWEVLRDGRSREAVETAERYADGEVGVDELAAAHVAAEAAFNALWSVEFRIDPEGTPISNAARAAWNTALGLPLGEPENILGFGKSSGPRLTGIWCIVVSALHAAGAPPIGFHHEGVAQCRLVRDLLGNPFRPLDLDPAILIWRDNTVVRLAEAAYRERLLPSGLLDNARLAVLADAVEESGCADSAVPQHLRSGGEHVRGCFVIDLLLGKS